MGEALARRGDLAAPPAPPLILASKSPQRRAILEQLGLPFEVVAPSYEERGHDPVELAAGKARSVDGGDRPVLGVDTEVVVDGEALGKPADAGEAEAMLEQLAGGTHEVVSGLCLRTSAWEELHSETTRVTFRPLDARTREVYDAVRAAHDRAIEAVRPGQSRFTIDAAARDELTRRGFGEVFGHGTGHGLGLEVHEDPRIGRRRPDVDPQEDAVTAGMVFTIEPGAYLPGWGGVRIEDDVVVTQDGVDVLTQATTELIQL